MLQPGEHDAVSGVDIILDLGDRGNCTRQLGAEELHANGTDMLRHAMQHETRRGDDTVAAFLLDRWQSGQELVSDVLAKAGAAKGRARHRQYSGLGNSCFAIRLEAADAETHFFLFVDLSEVVIQALDLQPVRIRRNHAPRHKIVQCRTPQHRFLATGVHRDIAADAGRIL